MGPLYDYKADECSNKLASQNLPAGYGFHGVVSGFVGIADVVLAGRIITLVIRQSAFADKLVDGTSFYARRTVSG